MCDGREDVQRVQSRLCSRFGSTPHLLWNSREVAQFSKPQFPFIIVPGLPFCGVTVMSKYDDNNIVISSLLLDTY